MKIFEPIYNAILRWSRHPHAPTYLGIVSVAESSFFPIPVDVMLAPMVLARRDKAWWYATIATVASVFGGILGYLLGAFLFDTVGAWLLDVYHARESFEQVQGLFREYGVWIVFVAGFTPVPYKVFTITSGVMGIALIPFIIASLVGRAGRFFLVAGIMYWGGKKIEDVLQKWVEWIGWITLAVIVLGVVLYRQYG